MLIALGFLAASLLGLLVASAFWSRAVRLTTQRIKQSMPVSEPEIQADRDRLRAEYAIKVHKLEMALEQAKLERARHIIDINRRDASIATLESRVMHLEADLEENQNARRVLEQTVADRLPRVEARLAEAKRLLFNRDREIAELSATARRHKQALEEASSVNAEKSAQIDRLTTALTARGGRGQSAGDAHDSETAMRSEIEMLRSKTSEQALLIDRLQRRLGHAPALAAPANPGDADSERARHDISEAEAAIASAKAAGADSDPAKAALEREVRALTAKNQDQAGEIARLKAALAAFEKDDGRAGGGFKDSKIALKARLGSAQAQADQQQVTITKLRADLASAHERLARQAAHFMAEMRRIAGGASGALQPARRPALVDDRRSLVERVAQVRASAAMERTVTRPTLPRPAEGKPAEALSANGHGGNGNGSDDHAGDEKGAAPAAAEMPKASEIPEKRRRSRLLDRITGATKG